MDNEKTNHDQTHNEEFGHEFGDMNAAKFYETPFLNEAHKKSAKRIKNCKSRD